MWKLVDKCTKELNNDVEIRIEELYSCSEALSNEFKDDYEDDVHNTNLTSSNIYNSDLNDAFREKGNRCDDIDGNKSGDDGKNE